jgi:diguanylate cyclase (GGDEF)-like protein
MTIQTKTKTPSVLDKLASLTTIRDIDLFELSFLKSLTELLKIRQLSMYKLNQSRSLCRLITYTVDTSHTTRKQKISESQEIQITEVEIPPQIKLAQDWINSTNKPYISFDQKLYLVVYPIIGAKGIMGFLSLEVPQQLTDTETLVITSLLRISQNFHSLLEENQKDKLTGLLNRKTLEDNINKIQALLIKLEHLQPDEVIDTEEFDGELEDKFWLAVIDIDNFKPINDNFGHVFGDEVLLLLAHVMQKSFRSSDLLFRYGGEEFIVIIRAPHKEDAEQLLERFRCTIAAYKFPQINTVTISIGVTAINSEFAIPSNIVGRADKALYYAKEQGRNQLHFYEDLVENGHIIEKIEIGSIDLF